MNYRFNEYKILPDAEYADILWARIQHFKNLKHLSWNRLATHLNLSLPNIFRYRKLHMAPKIQKIIALSRFLDVSIDDLVDPYKPLPPSNSN